MAIAALMTLGFNACTSEEAFEEGETLLARTLRVTANVARNTHTRAYQDTGRVVNGKYYLAYPNMSYQYAVATVDFDRESAASPGLGIVTTPAGTELKWSEIGGSPVNFYLDNVPPQMDSLNTNGSTVTFRQENPFVAGVFDTIGGTNDLLWGDKSVTRDTKSVSFDLHHNMSRLKVQVKVVHKDNSVADIDLSNATVKITNLFPRTLSYDRLTGSLALDTVSGMSPIAIVDPARSEYQWTRITDRDENPDTTTYFSPDIVLPPQALLENEERPQLVITIGDTEYTGILPHAMMIASPDGTLNYPVTLSFLKEYILTIRTVITEEPPELAFMPVYVVGWVDKGEFTEEAHQSGIYTAPEFYKMIDYYEKNNQYQLVRYGYLTVPKETNKPLWHFDFWSSVVLDYNEIYGKMHPGTDATNGQPSNFEFSYNNYTVYVQNGEGEQNIKAVSETDLYKICTGQMTWAQL